MADRRRRLRSAGGRITSARLGGVILVLTVLAGLALFNKDRIITALEPGTALAAHFASNYRLQPYRSQVKVAGIPVGTVTDIDQRADGSSVVRFKVDDDVPAKLRSAPRARIRPTTVLGGNYYLDLVPGGLPGEFTGEIPVNRTSTPVELDKIARAFPPDTLEAARNDLRRLDRTLRADTRRALDRLLSTAPGTLEPAGEVLTALRGTRPDTDLTTLVRGLESMATELIERRGELTSSLTDLHDTADVLGDRGGDLAETIRLLPATFDSTRAGLRRLDRTLRKLDATAGPARPAVRRLAEVLATADPVLAKARPLINDARELVSDARPLLRDLGPVARDTTQFLGDLDGKVLERANGPIKRTVLSPYRGSGRYPKSGGDDPFYRELAHMVATVDRASALTDANGAAVGYHAGVAPATVAGLPISLEQLFSGLAQLGQRQVGG